MLEAHRQATMQQSAVLLSPGHVYDPGLIQLTPANSIVPLISGKDAIAGAAGGTAAVLLGQPFDLLRVRMQAANTSNAFRVARDIATTEGLLAFYKGAAAPFIGAAIGVSIQFTTYHSLRQAFAPDGQTITQNYLFGGVAGFTNSIISSPAEHIRTRLQLQRHDAPKLFNGPTDCVRWIYRQAGPFGIFKAYPIAAVKEFQAFGCYFAAYETSIAAYCRAVGKLRKDMSVLETIPCGSLGGIGFWVGSFPIDMIKTRLQGDGFGSQSRYSGVRSAIAKTWQEGGFKAFWRGLSPTLVRTSLSSAGCFTTVEQMRKVMSPPEESIQSL